MAGMFIAAASGGALACDLCVVRCNDFLVEELGKRPGSIPQVE